MKNEAQTQTGENKMESKPEIKTMKYTLTIRDENGYAIENAEIEIPNGSKLPIEMVVREAIENAYKISRCEQCGVYSGNVQLGGCLPVVFPTEEYYLCDDCCLHNAEEWALITD